MRIKFACPHCDRVCRVPYEMAGKQGRCPGCQKGIEVPTESTLQSHRHEKERSASGRKQPPRSGAGRVSGAGAVEEARASGGGNVSGQGRVSDRGHVPGGDPSDEAAAAEAALQPQGVPWQVVAAMCCFLLCPLPGLLFAVFGLLAAKRRRKYVELAYAALGLNVANLVFGIVIYGVRAIQGSS